MTIFLIQILQDSNVSMKRSLQQQISLDFFIIKIKDKRRTTRSFYFLIFIKSLLQHKMLILGFARAYRNLGLHIPVTLEKVSCNKDYYENKS